MMNLVLKMTNLVLKMMNFEGGWWKPVGCDRQGGCACCGRYVYLGWYVVCIEIKILRPVLGTLPSKTDDFGATTTEK